MFTNVFTFIPFNPYNHLADKLLIPILETRNLHFEKLINGARVRPSWTAYLTLY